MSNNNYNPNDVNKLDMADKIIEWSILEGKHPFDDEDMLEDELWEWLQDHYEYEQYIQDQIIIQEKIKNSKRKNFI